MQQSLLSFVLKKKIRRNITNKHGQRQWKQHIIQDHSSLIDTFIDWKSWKTHLRHFNFSKFLGRHATCPPKLDEAFSFIFVYLVSQATHKILAKSPSYTRVNEDPYIFDQILLPTANQNYRIGLGGGVYLWFCQGSTMGIYIVKNSSIPTSVGHLQHFF